MAADIAVLSYHGWEIDPDRLASDIRHLRNAGWRDVSLEQLAGAADSRSTSGRLFHVTIDDGAEGDRDCAAVIRQLSSTVTLFLPLEAMTDAERTVHRELAAWPEVALEDHSLRHSRTFHYRHIVGFHASDRPMMSSPERLGLQHGDAVCTYGGELVRRRFVPDPRIAELCRATARTLTDPSGSASWTAALSAALVERGLASWRFGKLCAAGSYESPAEFVARLDAYLRRGCDQLRAFTGRAPVAFAHPWWEPGEAADRVLRTLGYRLTFSGRGLWSGRDTSAIARLPISNSTPRPLDPFALAAVQPAPSRERVLSIGRRMVFA